jgi:AcrR family transcriptional regulator
MERMSGAGATAGRRARTPSADVERELLAAAEAVLVRDGPAAVTVRAVAAEAGIAPMGVYSRFGGKDGLIEALLVIGFNRLREAVVAADEPDMPARLLASGRRYREFALANRHLYAIMFGGAIPHDLDSAEVGECAGGAFDALVRLMERAAAAGVVTAPDPAGAAQQLWSAVHGAVSLELQDLVQAPDPAAAYEALLATLVRGLAP